MSLLVIALGGNALLPPGAPADAAVQQNNIRRAARMIATLAADHSVVVTHGNGPQVGLLALQSAAYKAVRPYPLDVLGAESEGMIGYMLDRELANLVEADVATLITQVVVDRDDPAFTDPQKPVGPFYDEAGARALADEFGWTMRQQGEAGYRRFVASPLPRRIVELNTIKLLVAAGALVICAGGGGVPVMVADNGLLSGLEAVIDKDRTAALLAREVGADVLLVLTDVDGVYTDWGSAKARRIRRAHPDSLDLAQFEDGTMRPKVAGACDFASAGGVAYIGALSDAPEILAGTAGTEISARAGGVTYWPG